MSVENSDFIHQSPSICCGAVLYDYNDGWGVCSHCNEWSESEQDFEESINK